MITTSFSEYEIMRKAKEIDKKHKNSKEIIKKDKEKKNDKELHNKS
jgi:hypothetical protein